MDIVAQEETYCKNLNNGKLASKRSVQDFNNY